MTTIGQLRHLVSIQRQTQTQDADTGLMSEAWEEVAQVRAQVIPVSAREFIASQASQSQITAKIVIRYRSDVDATMRVVHRGAVYNIAAALPDMESGMRWLVLPCTSGVNEGAV